MEEEKECTCTQDCASGYNSNCTCKNKECKCTEKVKEEKKKKEKPKKVKPEEKIKDLENQVLHARADLINYRKRKEDETSRIMKYSEEAIIRDLLQTVDDFERAIKMDDQNLDDELSKFLEGFKMIYAHLQNILVKYEVKQIDGINKPFDPTYHQAVLTDKIAGTESGLVIEVLQKGYLFKDKVVRPAMVKVNE